MIYDIFAIEDENHLETVDFPVCELRRGCFHNLADALVLSTLTNPMNLQSLIWFIFETFSSMIVSLSQNQA